MKSFCWTLIDRLLDRITLATWGATSVVVAFLGPFNTYGFLPPLSRLAFWSALIGGAIILAMVICEATKQTTGEQRTRFRDAKVILIFSILFGPMIWGAFWAIGGQSHTLSQSIWLTSLYTCLITTAIFALRRILNIGDEPPALEPPLLRRFEGLRADHVSRISGRDHYVDVYTHEGNVHSALMRFSDAMDEMSGVDGARVHRSHWVAKNAVRAVERERGKVVLLTADAARIPVSRSFRDAAQSAGVI